MSDAVVVDRPYRTSVVWGLLVACFVCAVVIAASDFRPPAARTGWPFSFVGDAGLFMAAVLAIGGPIAMRHPHRWTFDQRGATFEAFGSLRRIEWRDLRRVGWGGGEGGPFLSLEHRESDGAVIAVPVSLSALRAEALDELMSQIALNAPDAPIDQIVVDEVGRRTRKLHAGT